MVLQEECGISLDEARKISCQYNGFDESVNFKKSNEIKDD
jgi:hypothetical protein